MHFDEPSWISREPLNHIVFGILVWFVETSSLLPTKVHNFATSSVVLLRTAGTDDPTVNQYRLESRIFFAILFTIVKQLDVAAAQQDYLVTLVTTLRAVPLPITVAQAMDPLSLDSNMNEDLCKLKAVLSDLELDAPMHPRLEDRPFYSTHLPERPPWRLAPGRCMTAGEWASINAFVARLHHTAPDVVHLDIRGLFAMIEAFELPRTSSQLEDVLPAAACWIIYAGQELKTNDVPYANAVDTDGSRRLPLSRGPLWTGPYAFNQARWQFWMQRLKQIVERADVSDTVKLAAVTALETGL